jgi:hypothetical protein
MNTAGRAPASGKSVRVDAPRGRGGVAHDDERAGTAVRADGAVGRGRGAVVDRVGCRRRAAAARLFARTFLPAVGGADRP